MTHEPCNLSTVSLDLKYTVNYGKVSRKATSDSIISNALILLSSTSLSWCRDICHDSAGFSRQAISIRHCTRSCSSSGKPLASVMDDQYSVIAATYLAGVLLN